MVHQKTPHNNKFFTKNISISILFLTKAIKYSRKSDMNPNCMREREMDGKYQQVKALSYLDQPGRHQRPVVSPPPPPAPPAHCRPCTGPSPQRSSPSWGQSPWGGKDCLKNNPP